MNAYRTAVIAASSLAIVSCDSSSTTSDTAAADSSSAEMSSMDAASPTNAVTKQGKGTGTVTAIDAAGGQVTLDHGPIPEIGWPAMKMTFKVVPAVIASAAVGDKVEFDVRVTGSDSEVTAIVKK